MIILTLAQITEKLGSSAAADFAELYEQFLPKVYRYISYRISDVPTAEDLTSSVFEKALNKFKTYSSQKAQFSTWIFTIARNTLIDYYRSRSSRPTVTLDDPAALSVEDASPEDATISADESRHLNACLAKLSPQEQEIISLKFGAEMTNRQIAATLALGESNVGVILYRSVRKLRDEFGGKAHG